MSDRLRRLRTSQGLRDMLAEHSVFPANLILPLFVQQSITEPSPIASLPGHFRLPLASLGQEAKEAINLGLKAVLLFGIPQEKSANASHAASPDGIVQQAIRQLKQAQPNLLVITDVCVCSYTESGHCGILHGEIIDNDATTELLAKIAVRHAEAGADIVAPSAMMDGQVLAIRDALDNAGHTKTAVLAYAAKFASAFYGPFREAVDSVPAFGDRRTYQLPPTNVREALREARADIAQGADFLMVKPGLPYLDILSRFRSETDLPLAAYHVSGEYAMLKAAATGGLLDEKQAVLETLLAFRRAGADWVITYYAKEAARWLS